MVVIVRRQTAIRARSVVSAVGCIRITFIESLSSAVCPPAKLVARLVRIEVRLSTRRKIAAHERGLEPLPGNVRPALAFRARGLPFPLLPVALLPLQAEAPREWRFEGAVPEREILAHPLVPRRVHIALPVGAHEAAPVGPSPAANPLQLDGIEVVHDV